MMCEFFLLLLSMQSAWDEIIALVDSTAFPLALSNLIVIGFFIYLYWYDREEQNKYEGCIAQLEDSSKHAQMNPHFIFNALNGMQSILLLQGEQKANQYLGMLSKLLRYTLDNSVQERIALADELNYLKAYIELNKMHMGDSFEYCIDNQIDVDPKECYIPPMLIQPIVENAIVHGLSPKSSGGILLITIKEIANKLHFTIHDNGVGISASKALKKKFKRNYKSYATKILRERIAIFNRLKKTLQLISPTS